ncbi:glycosyltransferase family 2 protein [Pontibacter chitinilyticus]|uniref:glycosyltransferase family 2 protein n=1 Tax=Pontibacter chitinilyticus TaxID=2674989 RepID=UPI00321ACC46
MEKKRVPLLSVVMATYNGGDFLEEQLTSIYNQTYGHLEVIVCDDGSTDATVAILQRFQRTHQLQYHINEKRQGVIKNFEKAISLAQGDYIALADQDDVWLPNKLTKSYKLLREIEQKSASALPAVVFTDLTVVDENLHLIHSSFWNYMKLNPNNTSLNRVLVENVATGCTLLMNKATVSLALPIPDAALMHDSWFMLVATCFGQIGYLPEQAMLYRQHARNVIGARQKMFFQKISGGLRKVRERQFSLLQQEIEQARAFYERFQQDQRLKSSDKAVLEAFICLKSLSVIRKKYFVLKHAFYGSTFKKALNVFLRV